MRLSKLEEIKVETLDDCKNLLKGIGVTDETLNLIDTIVEFESYRIDSLTITYHIKTNLGVIYFDLKKLNSDKIYSTLNYWNTDNYKFIRNVNLQTIFPVNDEKLKIKYEYIER